MVVAIARHAQLVQCRKSASKRITQKLEAPKDETVGSHEGNVYFGAVLHS